MRSTHATITILALAIITPAMGATLHVPADYGTIQACIDAAGDGVDECVVAPGTYNEAINFIGNAITVRSSDGQAATTIDATGLNNSVVQCVSGEGADTVLDGFTITGGTGTAVGSGRRGGGMYNENSSSPTLTNCTFTGNSTISGDGGGMYNGGGSPTLTHCTFSGNSADGDGGGMYNDSSSPTLTDCTFNTNSAIRGGGMGNSGSSPTLTNCTFNGNSAISGGGMDSFLSSPTVTNCTFSGNSARIDGGAIRNGNSGGATVTGCTFSRNSAGFGGGMHNNFGSPTVTDCTFSENSAGLGGGMYNSSSSPTVTDCIFSGNSASSVGGGMYNSFSSNATLTNCTFNGNSATGNSTTWGGGMYNDSSSPTLTNCTFSGNSAAFHGGGGMFNINASSPTVANCILWNNVPNQISNSTATVTVRNSCVQDGWPGAGNIEVDPLFVDAYGLDGMLGTDDDDLHLQSGSPCIDTGRNALVTVPTDLDGNPRVIDGDQDGTATIDMGVYEFTLPLICGNGVLDPGEACDDGGESNMCDVDCTQAGCGDEVLNIAAGEQCDDGNLVSGDGCSAACRIEDVELHVPGDFPTIQTCINAAVSGNECVVAPGTYNEAINFNGKAITVRSSDGQAATTIDATGLNNSVVRCVSGEGADTVLDGFTITGGTGVLVDDVFPFLGGGGMYNISSSPTVTNCTFSGNSASNGFGGFGGGMYNDGGSPTVTYCTFAGNSASSAGGGMYEESSNPTVTNCTFRENSADGGGGMYNNASNPTVADCTFRANSASVGGGMYDESSNPTVTNCTFSEHSADGAGGMYNIDSSPTVTNCTFSENLAGVGGGMSNDGSSPTVTNCTFSGNSANQGGGMDNFDSSPTLTNCTFSGNSARFDGGGMFNINNSSPSLTNCTFSENSAEFGGAINNNNSSSPTVTNCILWNNPPNEIFQISNSTTTIIYSCVQGGWAGTGNIAVDPLFVDALGLDDIPGTDDDDLHLQSGSPCIDAGDPAFVPQPGETDLDGHARVLCGGVDMGAFEFGIGDHDCDRVVDLTDFAQWNACMTGPGAGPDAVGCEAFDFDGDMDIGLADFAGFQTVFQGQ